MRLDSRYVEARRVLLDALDALSPHGSAVIVAGAQAVYIRTGSSEIGIAPYTTDADLTLDPSLLADDPALENAMRAAGFRLHEPSSGVQEPGTWVTDATIDGQVVTIPVDLIVPEAVAPPGGRRSAQLPGHAKLAARRATGLEAALVDHSQEQVAALDASDQRVVQVEVAGTAALFVAKLHKIHDRVADPHARRANDKDAADVYRLMQTSRPQDVAKTMRTLGEHETSGTATASALGYLAELFGRPGGAGVELAIRALRLAVPEAQVRALCVAYSERLLG